MNTIFKKLNYRDAKTIHVLNAPDSFKAAMNEMKIVTKVTATVAASSGISFLIAFATTQKEVNDVAGKVVPKLADDAIFWIAYPKKSSKKYTCGFNRDTGWQFLGALGYEGVRMVAIDEDWSALRFRRAEKIKNMTRGFALSEAGKKRISSSKKVSSPKK